MSVEDILVNFAYIAYVIAFMVRNILWLRIIVVLSCIAMIIYGLHSQQMPIAAWNGVFLMINCVQIFLIYLKRRPISLPPDIEKTYKSIFSANFTKQEFLYFWQMGDDGETSNKETLICEQGKSPEALYFLTKGSADVMKCDEKIANIGEFYFIGEMSFLTNSSATADVIAHPPWQVHSWTKEQIKKLSEKKPELYSKLLLTLGQDLTRKIKLYEV